MPSARSQKKAERALAGSAPINASQTISSRGVRMFTSIVNFLAVYRRRILTHDEFSREHNDPLIRFLHEVIRFGIKILGVLMVAVILWGVADVVYVIYANVMSPPRFLLGSFKASFEQPYKFMEFTC